MENLIKNLLFDIKSFWLIIKNLFTNINNLIPIFIEKYRKIILKGAQIPLACVMDYFHSIRRD